MHILSHKKFINLISWKFDKTCIDGSTVKKIEVYNYISRDDVPRLIRYLQRKSFHQVNNTKDFHPIFNIILHHEHQHIYKGKVISDPITKHKYYYYVDFVRVISHRGSNFLIKIYRNKAQNKDFSKIEITYGRRKKGYRISYIDWANKLKGMTELVNRIEKKFNLIGYAEDFSEKQDILSTVSHFINKFDGAKKDKLIKILS